MNNISLIITYYNEQENLKNIFKRITCQSLQPAEVIFVDSNSTDNSNKILDNLIANYSGNIEFKNILFNTTYTSDSANLGIYLSKNELLSFMDCGLNFPNDWLENQYKILTKKNVDVVFGNVELRGKNFLDTSAVAQTYGYAEKNVCIPGSLIKKKVFDKIGFFVTKRSFYDVLWRKKVLNSNITYSVSKELTITYNGINYAKNLFSAFKKNFIYTVDLYDLKHYKDSYIYIYIPLLLFVSTLMSYKTLYYIIPVYFLARLVIPFYKSKKLKEVKNKIPFFLALPFSGLAIDFGKFLGNYLGLLKYYHSKGYFYLLFIGIIILLNTPFFWYLGNNLVLRDLPEQSDAIVVFSGDGEAGYINPSYQKRALDAVSYFNQGFADQIILSSGKKQILSEVNLLKILILSKGIPEESIKIFDVYPRNTSENIKLVNNYLISTKAKKILFITSPYHSKRAGMIWKKNNSNLKVLNVEVIDTPDSKPQWRLGFDEIYVICYEYLSILYNKYKGNL